MLIVSPLALHVHQKSSHIDNLTAWIGSPNVKWYILGGFIFRELILISRRIHILVNNGTNHIFEASWSGLSQLANGSVSSSATFEKFSKYCHFSTDLFNIFYVQSETGLVFLYLVHLHIVMIILCISPLLAWDEFLMCRQKVTFLLLLWASEMHFKFNYILSLEISHKRLANKYNSSIPKN